MGFEILLEKISKEIDGLNKEVALPKVMATLKEEVFHYDWVGIYELTADEKGLSLGPYVGKATDHTYIPVGKGVCGQVAEKNISMIVQDVSQEDNYIACSMDVQSEIVVPIKKGDRFVAQIDIDSHAYAPFTSDDQSFLEKVAALLSVYY
ncbi:GAF domain-containing protein [Halosquirtibacter xylanolyticus]|uniref:GAF domain-containing protein n=1 Tax=Halosquirtibacter xylanolyticus TaxID=3374599 RepID=UPI00374A21BC|nr:GAF domain-containing protein [Prolixibacteraceae bacterium]